MRISARSPCSAADMSARSALIASTMHRSSRQASRAAVMKAVAADLARATGKVGVGSVTCGPGYTQIMTALAMAARGNAPVVVFAGDAPIGASWYTIRGKLGMHTSPAYAEDVYIGALTGIEIGGHRAGLILPVNAPGATTLCRKIAACDRNPFVAPLSSRFDEARRPDVA